MKAIFVRSPYSIVVDYATQVETKLELYLWNKPNSVLGTPTYTFSALIPSLTQRTAYYNISNECQEYIENINPTYIDGSQLEQNSMWCYAKAITSYRTVSGGAWIQYSTETFACLYGYTEYSQGVNYSINSEVLILNSGDLTGQYQNIPLDVSAIYKPYINTFIQSTAGTSYKVTYYNSEGTYVTNLTMSGTETLFKIPIQTSAYVFQNPYKVLISSVNSGVQLNYFERTITPICETKYSPLMLSFINKKGGWENLWLMKLSETTITAKGTDYNISPSTFNYNIYKGQSKSFNRNGKKVIKTNTGWVDEDTSILITELMMSETIILNNEPVLLKSESQTLKQWVKDKNINYTLEFDYKNNLINNVV